MQCPRGFVGFVGLQHQAQRLDALLERLQHPGIEPAQPRRERRRGGDPALGEHRATAVRDGDPDGAGVPRIGAALCPPALDELLHQRRGGGLGDAVGGGEVAHPRRPELLELRERPPQGSRDR